MCHLPFDIQESFEIVKKSSVKGRGCAKQSNQEGDLHRRRKTPRQRSQCFKHTMTKGENRRI